MKKIFLVAFLFFLTSAASAANPELITTTIDGRKFDLAQQKGKIVIINFWAKWCPTCRNEMTILEELRKKYQSRGLEIIGVSIDRKKYREEVKKISAEFSYPNSLISDAEKISFAEPDSIPLNYIIDKKGNIAAILGDDEEDIFNKDFEGILQLLF